MSAILGRAVDKMNRLTAVLCVAFLVMLVVVASSQVFYRYVLQEPLVWSEEAARFLLIWLTFFAGGLVLRDDGHPGIQALSAILSVRALAVIGLLTRTLILVFLVVFIAVSADLAQRYSAFTSVATGISQAVPRSALPIGGVLMLLNLLPKMKSDIDTLRRPKGHPC